MLQGNTVAMPKKVKGCTISENVASADAIREAKKAIGQLNDKAMESKITLEVMKRRMRMERGKSKKKSLVELKHDRLEAKV